MTEANQGTHVVESGHAVPGGHGHGGDGGHGGHAISPKEMRRSLLLHDRVFERSHEEIAGWLQLDRTQQVLDAGCGVGGMTAVFARLAGSVEAIDLDEANVTEARQRTEGTPNVRAATGDLTALPHDDATFDLVWCSRVIHHVDDMLAAVKELARVTRPGGTVAIREGGFPFRVLPEDIGIGERWLEDRLGAAGVGRFGRPRVPEEGSVPTPSVGRSSSRMPASSVCRRRPLGSTHSVRFPRMSRPGSHTTGGVG